jgi:uncharacterized repeat protein (TIGR03803 family)
LVIDRAGNLYGTTQGGGANSYYGAVFKLSPNQGRTWAETVLYSFDGLHGETPYAGLAFDTVGNLYGTMTYGPFFYYRGGVFRLNPMKDGTWRASVIHFFRGLSVDGDTPYAGVVMDGAGNLYGTTMWDNVYKLAPNSDGGFTESTVYWFGATYDGYYPYGGVILDQAGNLYGTTIYGGDYNEGVVYQLSPNGDGTWAYTILHSFKADNVDGISPYASLVLDAAGNLYGTTTAGGEYNDGTVFRLRPNGDGTWTESVLHSFTGSDGAAPYSSLVLDASGNLYGTTQYGGLRGYGVVFKLTPRTANGGWQEKTLYSFLDNPGAYPWAGLVMDRQGNLFGTTYGDGVNTFGSVFEITP